MGVRGYLRFPTISGDTIVFTAEDDLWRVSAHGGQAERLTAGVGESTHARFSPDGKLIAFKGRSEGPAEIYVLPAEGGDAQRLTFHGWDATPATWRPDGSAIIYVSAAGEFSRRKPVLHAIAPTGGEPTTLPYGPARSLAFGPNGALVVGRNGGDLATWKRYRGGTAGYLYVDATGDGQFKRVPDLNSNITAPTWVGGRLYFLSDHEGLGQVYSILPDGSDIRRHTNQTEYYARGLASDGQRLVYFAGGDIYLLEPNATEGRQLDISLATSRTQRARQFVPAGAHLDGYAPHPAGHSVAITTRGKAFNFGAWEGAVVQQGEPDGVRYRLITWLGDGKHTVSISDDGGEPRLVRFSADGSEAPRIYSDLDIGHVLELRAAPVGDLVALVNHRNEVAVVDTAQGTLRVLERSQFGRNELAGTNTGLAWSPDGKWLAYSIGINSQQRAIKLADVASGAVRQVTEPVLYDTQPAFDPAGRYLYFLSYRTFDPVQDNLQFDWGFPKGARPYLLTLRADQRSPFIREPESPKSEAERTVEEGQQAEAAAKPATPPEMRIDLDGITRRIVEFPVPEGRYGRVQGTHEGVLFTSLPVEGTLDDPWPSTVPPSKAGLESYHFESHKQERLVDGISDFEVTPDGKNVLIRAGDRLRVLKSGEKPQPDAGDQPGRESGWIDLGRVKLSVRPEAEWKQMFAETWRLQREQFWIADMGGVDWQRAYNRYAPLLDRIGSRGELSDLIWELQGELGSSHAYEIGGEYRPRPNYAQGYLGVDWRVDGDGRYTIARFVTGDPWNVETTSPLTAPGVNAQVGDAVVAINGRPVTKEHGPQELLVNQAGQEVLVTLQPKDGGARRTVTVRALKDDFAGRYRDWVEANRKAVHEATQGKVGYLHVPDMGPDGYAEFHRYFLMEYDHDALIVDVRWNGGGIVSPLVLEKLMRRRLGYSFQRWGPPGEYMIQSTTGNLVALTDENAGSDGDIFSHTFKMLKLGPLVGKRTWGGVIGIEPYISLSDGTFVTQPEFSFWFNDVGWGVENYGTDPDIEVDYPPQAYVAGKDPQLERAIAEAQRLLQEHPFTLPQPGPRPNRGFPPRG